MNHNNLESAAARARRRLRALPRINLRALGVDSFAVLVILSFTYCGGAGNASDTASSSGPTSAGAPAPLLLRLSVPQRMASGESIPMRLILENRGSVPMQLELGGEPLAFDFVVTSSDGSVVWRRLEGVPVESVLRVLPIAPGEVLQFEDVWHQQRTGGGQVAPGDYTVYGVLPVVGEDPGWVTETHQLRIEG